MQMPTIYDRLETIKRIASHEKLIIEILEVFSEAFSVLDVYLCRYSPIGFLGEGVISLEQNEIKYIHDLRYDIRTLPTIEAAIFEKKAKFYKGRELFEKTSSNYIIDSNVNSFLVVPLFSGRAVMGFIYSLSIKEDADFTVEVLEDITRFGEEVGTILQSSLCEGKQQVLSKRELEVMKEISFGGTTKEIADKMGISEQTVKQYVKLAIKKMAATNRTHAIAELFRKGILS
ncbi:helix-turn-helix transcriptional regulator [Planococcus shenhongbingii]|uniref:Helix-turn-helix transcriptional regulator n=1 Tax=Planococcus shenhongbingii TaxID=3058398 RepID=A0ABT8NEU9_9BACL|nr:MULTISPECIES: helix-turn-helix transcriptional regulator [unclassified Planococcus (in: firmicutes)]MDN7246419.1 helix-turn-helix transcriptional regulator [Planococcus sp. N017]WKA59411.1 helix-turn-helix transcriptional regulator [Planococcus sp. N016]